QRAFVDRHLEAGDLLPLQREVLQLGLVTGRDAVPPMVDRRRGCRRRRVGRGGGVRAPRPRRGRARGRGGRGRRRGGGGGRGGRRGAVAVLYGVQGGHLPTPPPPGRVQHPGHRRARALPGHPDRRAPGWLVLRVLLVPAIDVEHVGLRPIAEQLLG